MQLCHDILCRNEGGGRRKFLARRTRHFLAPITLPKGRLTKLSLPSSIFPLGSLKQGQILPMRVDYQQPIINYHQQHFLLRLALQLFPGILGNFADQAQQLVVV